MKTSVGKTLSEARRAAADLFWDGDWEGAAAAYERVVEASPRDVNALAALGMSYARASRFEQATEAYSRAHSLSADDPVLLQRLAHASEEAEQTEKASQAYLGCAALFKQQGAPQKAEACWQAAARLQPEGVEAPIALLTYYQEQHKIELAVSQCLRLCNAYRKQGRYDYAVRICEHALSLSPRNREVVDELEDLRSSETQRVEVAETPTSEDEERINRQAEELSFPDEDAMTYRPTASMKVGRIQGSPVENARRRALRELAENVFEMLEGGEMRGPGERSDEEPTAAVLISNAIDLQRRGKTDEAVAAYEKLLAEDTETAATHFNLGLLYQEHLQLQDATAQFQQATVHPSYAPGGHFALGECYRAQGRIDEALSHFLRTLEIMDLAMIEDDRREEVIDAYNHLAEHSGVGRDRHRAQEYVRSIVDFVSQPDWERRVRATHQSLDALAEGGPVVTLGEALTVSRTHPALGSLASAQAHAERGLYYSALEECYLGLETAPTYLPLHRQLALIVRRMGKLEEAIEKLVAIARTYRVRGASHQAVDIYRQALKLAPMDTALRSALVKLEVERGQVEEGMRQYLILADSFQRLAQLDRAEEVYEKALRLVPRLDREKEWKVRILHEIGDLAMRRVDWHRALSVYEEIGDLAPDDERARLSLIELHQRMGEPRRAMDELDELLTLYRDRDEPRRGISVLRDMVQDHPDALALRMRLSQALLDAGHIEEAAHHLDRLAELQLAAGQVEQAKATIRAIIALQPDAAVDYRALLEQIEEESWG